MRPHVARVSTNQAIGLIRWDTFGKKVDDYDYQQEISDKHGQNGSDVD